MKLSIDKHEKYVLVNLEEDTLESPLAPELKSQLVYFNAEGFRNIIVNLSQVKYADSSGLSALLVGNRLCEGSDGVFVITNLQESVQQLIEISQLENVLNIIPSVEESIDFVFIQEIEKDLGTFDEDESNSQDSSEA